MKNRLRNFALSILASAAMLASAQSLVLLHTNDTHSHIDADNGVGGVLQRKSIVDSIRKAEKNVVFIDAGDIVQGTLYYKLFRGQVEYPLMERLGYDIQVLGNHEFDNGIDELANYYTREGAAKLSANYDFSKTPLKGVFDPCLIKTIGGKKVGFFGLNLDPEGIIGGANSRGLGFKDIIETANSTAALLRKKGCKLVVAVSHIGYKDDTGRDLPTDPMVAAKSRGIDIIIGGHSHQMISPESPEPNVVRNLDGKPVLIAQTGRYGANLGYIKLDISHPEKATARLIPVAGVDSSKFDRGIMTYLKPYKHVVDSVNARWIADCAVSMINSKNYDESVRLSNMVADIAQRYACEKLDSIDSPDMPAYTDLAIMNSGGIRLPFPKGAVTEGQVLSAFPFTNRMVIVEISGRDLKALLHEAAHHGGQAVSVEAKLAYDPKRNLLTGALIGGQPIDDERTYYVATLDYLADGGDYMPEFKRGKRIWTDDVDFCAPAMEYIVRLGRQGIPLLPDPRKRIFLPETAPAAGK